jgi:hypothetical protein
MKKAGWCQNLREGSRNFIHQISDLHPVALAKVHIVRKTIHMRFRKLNFGGSIVSSLTGEAGISSSFVGGGIFTERLSLEMVTYWRTLA